MANAAAKTVKGYSWFLLSAAASQSKWQNVSQHKHRAGVGLELLNNLTSVIDMNLFNLLFCLLVTLVFIGCSSSTGPASVRELSSPPAVTTIDGEQVALAQPVVPEVTVLRVPLVEKLIDQSNQSLHSNRFDQAINLAERGLRIDRKEPRLYLVLAKTYSAKGDRQQASYFAEQGLRYVGKKQAIYRELEQYMR